MISALTTDLGSWVRCTFWDFFVSLLSYCCLLHALSSKFLFSLFYESCFLFYLVLLTLFACYKIKNLHLHLSPQLPDKNTPYVLFICFMFNATCNVIEKSQRVYCVWYCFALEENGGNKIMGRNNNITQLKLIHAVTIVLLGLKSSNTLTRELWNSLFVVHWIFAMHITPLHIITLSLVCTLISAKIFKRPV